MIDPTHLVFKPLMARDIPNHDFRVGFDFEAVKFEDETTDEHERTFKAVSVIARCKALGMFEGILVGAEHCSLNISLETLEQVLDLLEGDADKTSKVLPENEKPTSHIDVPPCTCRGRELICSVCERRYILRQSILVRAKSDE